jgi:hypothetical protein
MDLSTFPSEDGSLVISEMLLLIFNIFETWTQDLVLKLSGATDSD